MRLILSIAFFALALWRGVIDWQATIGQGNAFRPASIAAVWQTITPESYSALMPEIQASGLWDNGLNLVFSAPVLGVFLVIALLFWMLRRRKPRTRKLF